MWLVINFFDWYPINSDTNLIIFITFYVFVFWYRLWGKFQIIFSFTIRCLIYCHFMIINLFVNCYITRQVWKWDDYLTFCVNLWVNFFFNLLCWKSSALLNRCDLIFLLSCRSSFLRLFWRCRSSFWIDNVFDLRFGFSFFYYLFGFWLCLSPCALFNRCDLGFLLSWR